MKLSLFLAICLGSAMNILAQNKEIYFHSEEDRFDIMQVGQYEEKSELIDSEAGEVFVNTYFFRPDKASLDPNFLYLINVMTYPESILELEQDSLAMSLYSETLQVFQENMNAKIQYQTDFETAGHHGILARLSYNDGLVLVKTKVIMKENRFYSIQVFTKKEEGLNQKMDRYLDSFLLK